MNNYKKYGVFEDVSSLGNERRLDMEFDSRQEAERYRLAQETTLTAEQDEERGDNPRTLWMMDRHFFVEEIEDVIYDHSIYRL